MMRKRVLVVSSHPDDAELGLGGSIIKMKKQGNKVFIVDLTWGEPTPCGTEEKRRRETVRSTRILGIDDRINLGLENRFLADTRTARLALAEQIRKIRPDFLFCPYPEDAHPDHSACTKITEAARFYAKYTKIKLEKAPHYARYLFYYFCTHLKIIPKISFLMDISGQFREKLKAIKCYRSQFVDNFKNRGVLSYIEAQNRHFGFLANTNYAEGVYCKEAINIDEVASLL